MNQLREKLRRFMIGRYGLDQLTMFLYGTLLVVTLLGIFLHYGILSWIQQGIEFLCILLICFRTFSRNISRRSRENQIFLNLTFHINEYWKKVRFRFSESRRYKIFKCPGCSQKVRIPRGHGKVSIHCPKCGKDFIKRS